MQGTILAELNSLRRNSYETDLPWADGCVLRVNSYFLQRAAHDTRNRRGCWNGGAAVGGAVGAVVGHPGAGAAVGGVFGLGAGALIGDQIQALQKRQTELEKQLKSSQSELENQRKELERLKKESKEY
jgi:outer membrane lipoprotein SlyB